jgi:hypothetical protein
VTRTRSPLLLIWTESRATATLPQSRVASDLGKTHTLRRGTGSRFCNHARERRRVRRAADACQEEVLAALVRPPIGSRAMAQPWRNSPSECKHLGNGEPCTSKSKLKGISWSLGSLPDLFAFLRKPCSRVVAQGARQLEDVHAVRLDSALQWQIKVAARNGKHVTERFVGGC